MEIIEEKGLIQVSDDSQIEIWVDEVLGENPQSIEDIKMVRIELSVSWLDKL